jgi:hypothetical protein
METNWIAWLIMGLFFFPYWIFCLKRFGLEDTVSAYWYRWKELTLFENRKMINKTFLGKVWFTFALIGVATPLFAFLPEEPHNWEFLFFIGVGGIWLTGLAAAYKKSYVEKYHVYGAIIGITFTLVAQWVVFGLWEPFIFTVVVAGVMHGLRIKQATHFVEVSAVITTWITLAIAMLF